MATYRLGVVVHPAADVRSSLDVLVEWCRRHGVELVAPDGGRGVEHAGVAGLDGSRFAATVDGVVSLGGDGTMLGAMRALVDRPVPVLGVNHGNLGFLVEVQPDQLPAALDRLVGDAFEVETLPCLRVDVVVVGAPEEGAAAGAVAFNDVVLARRGGESAVTATLQVDGAEYGYYHCDALVVATPIGSTAYNYAAGGPVLSPSTRSVVVSPVAPMSGFARAAVLADSDEVDLLLQAPSREVVIETDGVAVATAGSGDAVRVRVQRDAGQVVRLDPLRHARTNMAKLGLLGVPLRGDQLRGLLPPEVSAVIAPDPPHPR